MSDSEEQSGGGAWLFIGALIAVPVIAVVGLLAILMQSTGSACRPILAPTAGPPGASADAALPADASVGAFGFEQLNNAFVIANVAFEKGLGDRGAFLGIMAAIGESTLVNLDHGDDVGVCSLGLFQQQWCLPGGAWGSSPDDVMDPANAASMFFDALQTVASWQTDEPTIVINMVQGNADPFHYAPYEADAQAILDYLTSYISGTVGVGQCGTTSTGNGELAMPLDVPFVMTSTYGPRVAPTAGASTWHPAYDLINPGGACGAPIYSIADGTVIAAVNSWLQVRHDTGESTAYLHSPVGTYTVAVGDRVAAGQQIAAVGTEGPSTGCHLDIRIDNSGATNPNVAALENYEYGGFWVNPNLYWQAVAGTELCGPDCLGSYSAGFGA